MVFTPMSVAGSLACGVLPRTRAGRRGLPGSAWVEVAAISRPGAGARATVDDNAGLPSGLAEVSQ